MSYLLDKKIKKKRFSLIILSVLVCLILFYFRLGIWNSLSYISQKFFHPVLVIGNNLGAKFGSLSAYFTSKNSLYLENEHLQTELNDDKASMANYDSLLADNASMKDILGRKDAKSTFVLAAILAKPNQSPYDTLVIDAGQKEGLQTGEVVFASGNVPIGRVSNVYPDSSKVILFSNPGEKTQVGAGSKNIFLEVTGRGGGNFEMVIPKDLTLAKGDQVLLPGINSYVLGIVETTISDPRDPFVKALIASPVNVQELKFVEVTSP